MKTRIETSEPRKGSWYGMIKVAVYFAVQGFLVVEKLGEVVKHYAPVLSREPSATPSPVVEGRKSRCFEFLCV